MEKGRILISSIDSKDTCKQEDSQSLGVCACEIGYRGEVVETMFVYACAKEKERTESDIKFLPLLQQSADSERQA